MADQIKPRYRLGTQWHLDNAKDDATKIPERTLFRVGNTGCFIAKGQLVVRQRPRSVNYDDLYGVKFASPYDPEYTSFLVASDLQPLI